MLKKKRNYSFMDSDRIPPEKMSVVNGLLIPSIPGSCYHAIICSLAENKNRFCTWEKICDLTQQNMKRYGGVEAWKKFSEKRGKSYKRRIKDNTHTLTRTGKDCYGLRLHEHGMTIYFFKDGAMLLTGGRLDRKNKTYDITFPDGRTLQKRYKGTTMTYQEYKVFIEKGYINESGEILDHDAIRTYRILIHDPTENIKVEQVKSDKAQVCITLSENYDQSTADRLLSLGLIVEQTLETEVIGHVPIDAIDNIQADKDVVDIVVI